MNKELIIIDDDLPFRNRLSRSMDQMMDLERMVRKLYEIKKWIWS